MDSAELEKQVDNKSNYNRNSNGIGGFGYHGKNINRNGRPKSGQTWRDILIEVGETVVSQSEGKSYKLSVATKLWQEALKGNVNAMKVLFDRMDGLAKAIINNDKEKEMDYQMERLVSAVDAILENKDEEEHANNL